MNAKDLERLFESDIWTFWADLDSIDRHVSWVFSNAADTGLAQLCEIQAGVRAAVDQDGKMAARFTGFAEALLRLRRLGDREPDIDAAWEAFERAAVRAIGPERQDATDPARLSREVKRRCVEVLMEDLTAAWLGLYFLGIPMAQPWDCVRELAYEVGGYPSGACIYKYIGDIYRTARQQVVRERGELKDVMAAQKLASFPTPDAWKAQPLLVLTYRPLGLLEDDIARSRDKQLTPETMHRLARRYATLQMRLYTKQGFGIRYYVPDRALGRTIAYALRDQYLADDIPPGNVIEAIRDAGDSMALKIHLVMKKTFNEESGTQWVKLLKPVDIAGLPVCVLGSKTGVYSLDGTHTALHFAGNLIRDELLSSYRDKLSELNGLPEDRVDDLLGKSPRQIKELVAPLVAKALDEKDFMKL